MAASLHVVGLREVVAVAALKFYGMGAAAGWWRVRAGTAAAGCWRVRAGWWESAGCNCGRLVESEGSEGWNCGRWLRLGLQHRRGLRN